uniref:Uncharacterized protein n=1 Tax=Panagrolaimus sp. ES5 TaxID=591445 RepID=A0AC34GS60_9BILA
MQSRSVAGDSISNGILNIYPNSPSNTEAYQQAAKLFEASIDTSVNPCDDFYQYSCGKFNGTMSFDAIDNKVHQEIIDALNTPNDKDPIPVKNVKAMYQQCLKDRAQWDEAVGNGKIIKNIVLEFMVRTNLSFPLFDSSKSNAPEWPSRETISYATGFLSGMHGIDNLISSAVQINSFDPAGSLPYTFNIGLPRLFYPDFFYEGDLWDTFKPKLIKHAKETFANYGNLTNSDISESEIDEVVDEIVRFELYITNLLSTDYDEQFNATNPLHLIRYDNLNRKYSAFDFKTYVSAATENADQKVYKKISKPYYQYNIRSPKGLLKFNEAVKHQFYGNFSSNLLGNYFYFRLLYGNNYLFPSYLSVEKKEIEELIKLESSKKNAKKNYPFFKKTASNSDGNEIQEHCFGELHFLGYARDRMFADKLLPKETDRSRYTTALQHIIDNVLIGLQSMIDGLSWMSPATKHGAYEKLQNLVRNYVYPEWIMNDTSLTEFYSPLNLNFKNADYPHMLMYLDKFSIRKSFDHLLRNAGTDRYDFGLSTTTVNAWYEPNLNSITIPLGILQPPFFNPDWPNSILFGSMGIVAGHELTHAFDSQGVHWGPFGEKVNWLDPATQKHFDEMAECVIEEYNQFCPLNSSYDLHCVNGTETQGENIADNGGIHAAYRAYRNIIDFKGPDPLLPGDLASQFTHDQLFFLSFAQVWCEPPLSPDAMQDELDDDHSPSKYRIQGTIQNFPAFRSAFNCPIGSASAPKDHCNVWITDANITKVPQSADVLNIPEKHLIKPDDVGYTKYSQAQAFFQASMNFSADPCNNFYEYSCGAYNDMVSFGKIYQRNAKVMAKMLDDMLDGNYKGDMLQSSAINKTLTLYSACKKASKAKREKTFAEIKDGSIVTNILKNFESLTGYKFNWCDMNAVNNNSNDPKILAKALAHLSIEFGVHTLVTPSVDVNPKRDQRFASNFTLTLDQNILTYRKPFYQPGAWEKVTYPKLKQNMLQLFKDYTKSIGMECKIGVLEYNIENALEFEHLLATNFSASDDLRRNDSRGINPMAVGDIPFGFMDWETYVSEISDLSRVYFLNESDTENYWIMMSEPAMIEKLEQYFPEVGMDTVVKYLYYRLLLSQKMFIDTTDDKYIPLQKSGKIGRKQKNQGGKDPFASRFGDKDSDKSSDCAEDVTTFPTFLFAIDRIFTEALYPTPAERNAFKKETFKVIDSIKSSMQSMVEKLPWISGDDETLRGARSKIDNMQINAAFADLIFDNEKLDAIYEDINFESDDTFDEMLKKIGKFYKYIHFQPLLPGTQVDRTEFDMPAFTVNAEYAPVFNAITIPEGILQQPFFDPDWPTSIKFGGAGVVIGHEITHG